MLPFRFAVAQSPADAIAQAAAAEGARFYAGGTTLVDLMKEGVERPATLIDLNQLEELASVQPAGPGGAGLMLGALARNSDVAQHPLVADGYPLLAQAILAGASRQLRNMATVGGNLLQRTRCSYFRDLAFGCEKREPGTGCSAIGGPNRGHAILGTSERCIATHASDMAVALAALEARVHVAGPEGAVRTIAFEDLHLRPGDTPQRETSLREHELITAVEVPPLAMARRSMYLKVRDRASYEFALVSAAVAIHVDGGVVRDVRIGLGGVGTVPWRAREAEQALLGGEATVERFAAAADAALADAVPRGDNDFKVPLARATLVRVLRTLTGA